jgi:transposase
VVAIDPSAAFKKAITNKLPNAKISVDPFHLVQLANLIGDPNVTSQYM